MFRKNKKQFVCYLSIAVCLSFLVIILADHYHVFFDAKLDRLLDKDGLTAKKIWINEFGKPDTVFETTVRINDVTVVCTCFGYDYLFAQVRYACFLDDESEKICEEGGYLKETGHTRK